jgi:DNA-binding beta-propeller fold protein YncE
MRTIFGITLTLILASLALAVPVAVIPNGGAGVGSLSVINPATGMVERSLVTAIATGFITNFSFAITNTGESAAVLGYVQRNPGPTDYILSAVNLRTGRITGQRELSFAAPRGPVMVATNPKASVLYLGYVDSSANFHIQALDPITLHVILDSNLGANGGQAMTVSPDGKTIYLNGFDYAAVVAVQASNLKLIGTVSLSDSSYAAVSPDSSTLYVAAGKYPNMTLTEINAATLQVTQVVPLAEVSVLFGLAISPDGSQLYLSGQANFQGTDIFTLDLATQALMAVSVEVSGAGTSTIVVSPDGTVYVGNASEVVVFDPASQSVRGTFSVFGVGSLALNSTGSRLYFLNESSAALAVTGPPPSQTILGAAATGPLSNAAYDATNKLLLVADTAYNVEVLDARTFEPAGNLFLGILNDCCAGNVYLTASAGSGFAIIDVTSEVLRFDPVSLMPTGTLSLPHSPNYLVSYSQPMMSGSTLYVPFSFSFNGSLSRGPARFADSTRTLGNGIFVIDTLQMKLLATWPFPALPLLGLAPGQGVAYVAVPAAQQMVDLDEIDLSTGKIIRRVQIPEGLNPLNPHSNPAVSPDGSTIYLTTSNTLYTFNAQTLAITNTVTGIGLTDGLNSLTVSPEGKYVYGGTTAPCGPCFEQIVSTSSLEVIGAIPVSTAYPQPALFLGN